MKGCVLRPAFVSGPSGRLFCTVYSAVNSTENRWIIHVPAFAEEMNKSRAMVSEQARAFARAGYTVIVPDLYGTGDSEGDFAGASWEKWKLDIVHFIRLARSHGAVSITLWGLRLGCLLAADIAAGGEGNNHVNGLLFWQPVHSGKQFITQFLRLRLAAVMMSGKSQTVADLRAMAKTGQSLEVAGYELSPALLSQIDKLDLLSCTPVPTVKVRCLELLSKEGKPASLSGRKLVEAWSVSSLDIELDVVVGPAFWAAQEVVRVPALIAKTMIDFGKYDEQESAAPDDFLLDGGAPNLDDTLVEHEMPCVFPCGREMLLGMGHSSPKPAQLGVVLVVGGPQYRVGSHRQFVLLARALASLGIPVFRFDYRGMGDSSGSTVGFDGAGEDIRCAIDQFQLMVPSVKKIVIWGLCDGATAAIFYAPTDPRVSGLVILNPWVRSEEGAAKAFLKHYYLHRLIKLKLWRKSLNGKLDIRHSIRSFFSVLSSALGGSSDNNSADSRSGTRDKLGRTLGIRVKDCLNEFDGEILLILSGDDLTAAEFKGSMKTIKGFEYLLKQKRCTVQTIDAADHTFSRRVWRDDVVQRTAAWILSG